MCWLVLKAWTLYWKLQGAWKCLEIMSFSVLSFGHTAWFGLLQNICIKIILSKYPKSIFSEYETCIQEEVTGRWLPDAAECKDLKKNCCGLISISNEIPTEAVLDYVSSQCSWNSHSISISKNCSMQRQKQEISFFLFMHVTLHWKWNEESIRALTLFRSLWRLP